MTISFVAVNTAEATSIALPAHQKNDLIIVAASRFGTTSFAGVPAAWNGFAARASSSVNVSCVVGWIVAKSDAEVSGTWANADSLIALIYRKSGVYVIGGGRVGTTNNSPPVIYPSLANSFGVQFTRITAQNARYLLIAETQTTGTNLGTPPSGTTNRASHVVTGKGHVVVHEVDTESGSFAGITQTIDQSAGTQTFTLAIEDLNIAIAGGGMLIHPAMSGGMRG